MRKAFTLIELMISISLLSIMMLFLYQSYASLNRSNQFYAQEVSHIVSQEKRKEVLFLDISLALFHSIKIIHKEKDEDVVFLQSANSLHQNYNPYIAYIKKENNLYRLESLEPFKNLNIGMDHIFEVDSLGTVEQFRLYKDERKKEANTTLTNDTYLLYVDYKKEDDILMKIKSLNEY